MGLLCVLSTMLAIIVLTWVISRWDARTAYRLLETSQSLFEPDEASIGPEHKKLRGTAIKRHVTPLTNKRVAARQKLRCNCGCGRLLDESYEVDHIVPISEGGTNKEDNLQALLRSCHQRKSAREQAR